MVRVPVLRHLSLSRSTLGEVLVEKFPKQCHFVRLGHAVKLDELGPPLGGRYLVALVDPLVETSKEIIVSGIGVLARPGEARQKEVEAARGRTSENNPWAFPNLLQYVKHGAHRRLLRRS